MNCGENVCLCCIEQIYNIDWSVYSCFLLNLLIYPSPVVWPALWAWDQLHIGQSWSYSDWVHTNQTLKDNNINTRWLDRNQQSCFHSLPPPAVMSFWRQRKTQSLHQAAPKWLLLKTVCTVCVFSYWAQPSVTFLLLSHQREWGEEHCTNIRLTSYSLTSLLKGSLVDIWIIAQCR